jgi:hypothetical protein
MTGETSDGARRVRVVPRPGPGERPPAGPAPVDADTEVLPRVGPGPRRPGPPPAPSAPSPGHPDQGSPGPSRPETGRPEHQGRPAPRGRTGQAAAAAVAAATGSPVAEGPHADPEPASTRRAAGEDDDEAAAGPERRYGMGTPALVLGLLAAGTCWTGWAGVVLGLFGAAAGYLGARRAWKGLATDGARSLGGLALGAIGLVVGVVVVWPTLFGTGNFGDGLTLDQCLQQANGAFQMHMCKSQHITEFNQRFPNAST